MVSPPSKAGPWWVAEAGGLRVWPGDARGWRQPQPARGGVPGRGGGRTYAFHKYFAVFTGNDRVGQPLTVAAAGLVQRARALGYQACLAQHTGEWKRKWSGRMWVIAGDDAAQLALRYSILQLLMVAPVAGSANSIPARALSGQVYKGAVFWDTEMFMFPFFLHTDPAKAAELLRYRIRTLGRRPAQSADRGTRLPRGLLRLGEPGDGR